MVLFLVGGSIINFFIFYHNGLSVGILTLENYYLFSLNFNKPHTKLPLIAMGCWMGQFYLNILEYRKSIKISKDNKNKFWLIDLLHTSIWIKILIVLFGVIVFNITTLIPFTANRDAYSWNNLQNSFCNALSKIGYITPIMGFLALMYSNQSHILHPVLGSTYFRTFSKLTFGAYLVYPIMIMLVYTGMTHSIFLSRLDIVYLFIYNLVSSFLVAFFLFMILQSPIQHLVSLVIFKYRQVAHEAENVKS